MLEISQLTVGTKLVYNLDGFKLNGIVVSKSALTITISWDGLPSYTKYNITSNLFWLKYTTIKNPITLTKEQIIQQRIHKLWNNSNWIKKHPEMAY